MSEILSQIHFINEEIKRLKREKDLLLTTAIQEDHFKENEYYLEILETKRVSVDTDRLKEEYPEIYEKLKKETSSYRKTVKIDKETAESNFAAKLKEKSTKPKKGDKSWRISM